MAEKENALDKLFASTTLVVCNYCGSTATYHGSPAEINKAAKEFYEIHAQHKRELAPQGKR